MYCFMLKHCSVDYVLYSHDPLSYVAIDTFVDESLHHYQQNVPQHYYLLKLYRLVLLVLCLNSTCIMVGGLTVFGIAPFCWRFERKPHQPIHYLKA